MNAPNLHSHAVLHGQVAVVQAAYKRDAVSAERTKPFIYVEHYTNERPDPAQETWSQTRSRCPQTIRVDRRSQHQGAVRIKFVAPHKHEHASARLTDHGGNDGTTRRTRACLGKDVGSRNTLEPHLHDRVPVLGGVQHCVGNYLVERCFPDGQSRRWYCRSSRSSDRCSEHVQCPQCTRCLSPVLG